MKAFWPLALFTVIFLSCRQDPVFEADYYRCEEIQPNENNDHTNHFKYQKVLDDMTGSGVPGVMMTIRDNEGSVWSGTSGKADLASNINMAPCHITRVGSTVKTFTAVTVLLLQEEGKLSIDDKISSYLTKAYLQDLANAGQLTIRQLLQHSSGLYNYILNARFQTASLNDLPRVWEPEELLSYARGKTAEFRPGTDVQYSNTNYILLGDIIEAIEGKPFYQVFEEKIFMPFGLTYTRFAARDPVPDGIARGYVDLYSNLELINTTHYSGWDYFTADGGLISNAYDLNIFMHALLNGDILTRESLEDMLTWQAPNVQEEDGFETAFGLGIFRISTEFGPAYLHSGDAIGYFASMVYFPGRHTTITWATNGNYGKIDEIISSKGAMEKIFRDIFN